MKFTEILFIYEDRFSFTALHNTVRLPPTISCIHLKWLLDQESFIEFIHHKSLRLYIITWHSNVYT